MSFKATDHNNEAPRKLSIKQNMLWNSMGSLTYLGCQWLITIAVVRFSDGYDAAGSLALAMSIYNIFAPLAIYRMYTYQVSDVNHENTAGEYLAFRIITCLLALVCILIYALLATPSEHIPIIIVFACSKIFSLLIDVLHGVDQLNQRMDYIGLSLILQGVGNLVCFSITLLVTNNITLAVLSMGAITILVGLIYDLPRTKQFESIKVRISRKKVLRLFAYCLPIVLATVACSATPSIPRQLLSIMQGDSALGIYASVAAPVAIIQMGASYIYNPLLSIVAEQFHEGKIKALTLTLLKVIAGICILGIACAIALEIFGAFVLSIMYGDSIVPYCYLLTPMIAAAVATAFVWFLNDILVALRCFSGSFAGNIVSVIIAVLLSRFFIENFNMNGVSFVTLIAYIASIVVMGGFLFSIRIKMSKAEKAN